MTKSVLSCSNRRHDRGCTPSPASPLRLPRRVIRDDLVWLQSDLEQRKGLETECWSPTFVLPNVVARHRTTRSLSLLSLSRNYTRGSSRASRERQSPRLFRPTAQRYEKLHDAGSMSSPGNLADNQVYLGQFLLERLTQLGVQKLFGVPGDVSPP